MMLRSNSSSGIKCWFNFWPMSWTWFSILYKSVACFGHTERSWCFFGVYSKVWTNEKYDSSHWKKNI